MRTQGEEAAESAIKVIRRRKRFARLQFYNPVTLETVKKLQPCKPDHPCLLNCALSLLHRRHLTRPPTWCGFFGASPEQNTGSILTGEQMNRAAFAHGLDEKQLGGLPQSNVETVIRLLRKTKQTVTMCGETSGINIAEEFSFIPAAAVKALLTAVAVNRRSLFYFIFLIK